MIRDRWPSYAAIAKSLEITHCTGACGVGNHRAGWANPSRGVIHFEERGVTRAGIRRFLMLYAQIIKSHNRGQPEWQRIYEQNQVAVQVGRQMGLRFPKWLSLEDRAKVDRILRKGTSFPIYPPNASNHDPVIQWARDRD